MDELYITDNNLSWLVSRPACVIMEKLYYREQIFLIKKQ